MDEWAAARGYERYAGGSVKGDACIDWDDKKARAALLGRIVGDADRLLELSRRTQGLLDEDSTERQRMVEASELLGQLLLQDVERTEEGVGLKEGVSRDRIVSVHDPEMRHGHKSSSKRFDGHKASVAVDTDSQVITAVDVLPGNASDNVGALELVERSEEGTVSAVEETIGDAAYGDGGTRQAFADAGRTLIAKLPRRPDGKRFPKEDFEIDLESGTCTCPAGHTTREVVQDGYPDRQNGSHPPTESLLVRRGGLRSVSAKRAVCGIRRGQRSDGETSSAGGDASAGSCVAEERKVCGVSSAASGGGAQVSASGTAWIEAGAVLRTYQDAVPAVDGSDGGQSDTGGWQSWEDGWNRLSVR